MLNFNEITISLPGIYPENLYSLMRSSENFHNQQENVQTSKVIIILSNLIDKLSGNFQRSSTFPIDGY